jgi:predicted MFS family arabinose efflux permease
LVVLLFLTWGTVFLDRMSLLYLAPFIAPDLHLSHTQVGLLVSALALAWAISGLILGAVSDRIGRRPVLLPAVFAFSVLSWLSGIVTSFGELFTVRVLMGFAEGPTWSTITATVEESSAPERRGRNVGVVVSAAALVGLALAPVLTTQIAARVGWRGAFFVAGMPGILLGLLLWKFVREPIRDQPAAIHPKPSWKEYFTLLRQRNILLCCSAAAGFMTWLFVMNAFAPLYITEVSRNSATFAGLILGASCGAGFCPGSRTLRAASRRCCLWLSFLRRFPSHIKCPFWSAIPGCWRSLDLSPMVVKESQRWRSCSFPPKAFRQNSLPPQSD